MYAAEHMSNQNHQHLPAATAAVGADGLELAACMHGWLSSVCYYYGRDPSGIEMRVLGSECVSRWQLPINAAHIPVCVFFWGGGLQSDEGQGRSVPDESDSQSVMQVAAWLWAAPFAVLFPPTTCIHLLITHARVIWGFA
jgi:hypothetical protein